jgi:hypothetical protein
MQALPNKTTLLFASIFLGVAGYDRYLLGYKNWWIKAITLGGLGVWTILDIYKIVTGKMMHASGEIIK